MPVPPTARRLAAAALSLLILAVAVLVLFAFRRTPVLLSGGILLVGLAAVAWGAARIVGGRRAR